MFDAIIEIDQKDTEGRKLLNAFETICETNQSYVAVKKSIDEAVNACDEAKFCRGGISVEHVRSSLTRVVNTMFTKDSVSMLVDLLLGPVCATDTRLKKNCLLLLRSLSK